MNTIGEIEISRADARHARIVHYRNMILKSLFLYTLPPVLFLLLFTQPIGEAVRGSDPAIFLILLAMLGVVCLNWFAYTAVNKRCPSLLVFAHGMFCLLLTVIVEYETLPNTHPILSTLAVIGGCLALGFMFLLSFWFASRHTKPAASAAVVLWVIIGVVAVFMLYRVIRDFEVRTVTADTWITLAVLAALIPAAFAYKIRSSVRRSRFRRRTIGLTEGKILQIIGETDLDTDDELVTKYRVLVSYTVDGRNYETRTDISKLVTRWFGRKAFIGQDILVHYDPDKPEDAYTDPIDRHFFDDRKADEKN